MLRPLQRYLLPLLPAGVDRWLPLSLLSLYRKMSRDVFIISYPCSGRTWLRLMIGRAFMLAEGLDTDRIWELHTMPMMKGGKRLPRVILGHDQEPFTKKPHEIAFDRRYFAGRKLIFLARDPRDLIVSWYFEQLKRGVRSGGVDYQTFHGPINDFVDLETGSIDTIIAFFNGWIEHHDGLSDFLLIRYEDLHHQPEAELHRCLEFCGYAGASEKIISAAVEFASFDNMRTMEQNGTLDWDTFQPGANDDERSFKTRQGQVGDHRTHLSPESCDRIDRKVRERLDSRFGYETPGGRIVV